MSSTTATLLALAGMGGFGLADFLAKTIVDKASAYRTLLLSQVIGSIPFLGLTLAYDRALPDRSFILLAIISGSLSGCYLLSYYFALSLGKASLVSPVASCYTAVAVLLSVLILGETLTYAQSLLIAAVVVGILLMAVESHSTQSNASKLSMLLSLVVIFGAGGNSIIQKLIAENNHWMIGFFFSRVATLGLLATLFPVFEKKGKTLETSTNYSRTALLGLIDVSAFFAYFFALRGGLVSILTPIVNSSTAITIMLAYIFLRERVLPRQKIATVTIILGVAILSALS